MYYLSLQSQIIVIHVQVVGESADTFCILIIPRVMTQVKSVLYQNTYKALKIEYKYTLSYILGIMSVRWPPSQTVHFFRKKMRLDIAFSSSSFKIVAISSKILVFSLLLSLLAHLPVPTVQWDCCKLCMAGTVVRAHANTINE